MDDPFILIPQIPAQALLIPPLKAEPMQDQAAQHEAQVHPGARERPNTPLATQAGLETKSENPERRGALQRARLTPKRKLRELIRVSLQEVLPSH